MSVQEWMASVLVGLAFVFVLGPLVIIGGYSLIKIWQDIFRGRLR